MNVKNVCVVGSGTMGNGIAQVCIQSGLTVSLIDISQEMLDRAMNTIKKSVTKLSEKGIVKEPGRRRIGQN